MSENAGHFPHTGIGDLRQERCGSIEECMDRTCKQLGINMETKRTHWEKRSI